MAIFTGRGEVEIDVGTIEAHRCKGLALHCAAAFLTASLEREQEPRWTCWPYRKGSVLLAEKPGFVKQIEADALYWSEDM